MPPPPVGGSGSRPGTTSPQRVLAAPSPEYEPTEPARSLVLGHLQELFTVVRCVEAPRTQPGGSRRPCRGRTAWFRAVLARQSSVSGRAAPPRGSPAAELPSSRGGSGPRASCSRALLPG